MTTQTTLQHARSSQLAVACAIALIANHKTLVSALSSAAKPPADAVAPTGYAAPAGYNWKAIGEQLEQTVDHAMHSISALHLAAAENRPAVQPDVSRATAQHALACLEGVLALHDPLLAAVQNCAVMGGGATWPSIWANMTFQLHGMRDQARGSIERVQISARQEAAQIEAQAEVFGEGEHEFKVMVTLQTTAHRFIHVRANDAGAAREAALFAARDEQGAHFVLNEGNHVSSDDLHANALYDSNGNEVWSDDPAFQDHMGGGEAPSM
jgi:hypothetical protein